MQQLLEHGYDLRFGPFSLNVSGRQLRHHTAVLTLKPKEAELLTLLARHHPRVVTKGLIIERLWPDAIATDAALSQTVYRLRRALATHDPQTQYIRTIPGIGFHFAQRIEGLERCPTCGHEFDEAASQSHDSFN